MEVGEEDNFSKMAKAEWWLSNSIGGWASSTIAGANTRKYHGLLVAAHPNAQKRILLLSKFEEHAICDGLRIPLSTNFYSGKVHPEGWKNIANFSYDGAVARWTYYVQNRRIAKEIWCERGANATYARYTLLDGQRIGIEACPLVNARDVNWLGLDGRVKDWNNFKAGMREINFSFPFGWKISSDRGTFSASPDTYYNFIYEKEREREEGYKEDLFCPGKFEALLEPGQHITLICQQGHGEIERKFQEPEYASARMERIISQFREHNRWNSDTELDGLVRSGEQFIIQSGQGFGILAGFPYFGEWARDTMISIPGLCAYTGKHALAREILQRWINHLEDGLLPNRFDESGNPAYESADGFLWMMWAIGELEKEGGLTNEAMAKFWPELKYALLCWLDGNKFVNCEADGLISLKQARLTWMDVQMDGKAVTGREGKRVEINALWINALNNASKWARHYNEGEEGRIISDAAMRAKNSMQKFYSPKLNMLVDGIFPDDSSFRPNQIWALALPDVGINSMQAKDALLKIKDRLWVEGKGLRTLAKEDAGYKNDYSGSQRKRDMAYHNGTIWPWLSGAYAQAMLLHFPNSSNEVYRQIKPLFNMQDGAVLSVPEVFNPANLEGDGCPSQAWSVAEVLRAGIMIKSKMFEKRIGNANSVSVPTMKPR